MSAKKRTIVRFFVDTQVNHWHAAGMKILVCIKQISSRDIGICDAHALEEAVRLKEKFTDLTNDPAEVDVITTAPPESAEIFKRAFGVGADRGYHIVTGDERYASPFKTASILAAAAEKNAYNLILTGIMSQDFMSGQTGPMLAELLDFPCITGVVKTRLPNRHHSMEVEQEMENGFCNYLKINLPAVLTVQAGINTPRYPTLSNMLAAEKKEIITIKEANLFAQKNEVPEAREIFVSMEEPEKTRTGRKLEGSLNNKVNLLLTVLQEKGMI